MILECLEGMYVTYTSEIFSDPRRKKKVFVEQYLGLFLTFLPFCARPSRYRAQFQASSFHLDSGNWPGDEAGKHLYHCTYVLLPDFIS